jgi:hypothetical protein
MRRMLLWCLIKKVEKDTNSENEFEMFGNDFFY